MFTLFIRSMLLYGLLIVTMRALGKRQLGELQPYELALTILLAEIIAGPIDDVSIPLLYGILPVAAVMVVHGVLSLLCMKSDKLRAVISGKPAVVISGGVINRRGLERMCLNLADLLEGLRCAGFLDPAEVGTAVIEANGNISAFAASQGRPVNPGDIHLQTDYEGLPMILIMDGRVQKHNLAQAGKDERWLDGLLMGRGLGVKQVYLASLDTKGMLLLQLTDDTRMQFRAMQPSEVKW